MTPEALAAIHAACFQRPRPWSADELASLLTTSGAFLLETEGAFLLGRVVAGEAELLTLAVAPDQRRKGIARDLVQRFLGTAEANADSAFLEVASDNAPAMALYEATGWQNAGLRRNYYAPGIDAVVMSHPLKSRI